MSSGNFVFEFSPRERIARSLLVAGIVAAHLVLIVWLGLQRTSVAIGRSNAMSVIGLSPLADPKPPAQPVRDVQPSNKPHPVIQLTPLPSLALATLADAPAVAAIGEDGGCALADQLRAAIMADPASLAELAALPAGVRTEADAVMLWNGQWMAESVYLDPSSSPPLRRLVQQLIAQAPEECRTAIWTGPQFIPITQGTRNTMLVVGSGSWRWQDLMDQPQECAPDQAEKCSLKAPTTVQAINYFNAN